MITFTIIVVGFGIPTALCLLSAYLHHKQKCPPLVNQWIWKSKQERKSCPPEEKALYYRFGRNVYLMLAVVFVLPSGYLINSWSGIWTVQALAFVLFVVYAFVESLRIMKKLGK